MKTSNLRVNGVQEGIETLNETSNTGKDIY